MLLERIIELVKKYDKPVAFYVSTSAQEVVNLKATYPFPIFTQVVETVRALEMSYAAHTGMGKAHVGEVIPSLPVDRTKVRSLIGSAQAVGRDLLLSEALEVLEHYGIPAVRSVMAATVEEATAAADKMGYPVAVKIVAEQISHKSDVGGVQLNLRNAPAVATACEDMLGRIHKAYPQVKIDGVLVQPMITGGRELILGGRQDPQFGPVVLVGLGGIFVEIFEEVMVRVAPISLEVAREMIDGLRGAAILKGARGHQKADIEALVQALLRLSQLLVDFPDVKEVDINPLRVFAEGEGCAALDARIIL
jgi:acyl-CoA synthetase (NDP forming)